MNVRECFINVMNGKKCSSPVLEWAPWWDKTIESWENEGLPKELNSYELFDYFGLSKITQFWFPHKSPNCPNDLSYGEGIIKNMADYERIKKYLYPKDAVQRMMPQIKRTVAMQQKGETVVWFTIDGFFWFPRVLLGIEAHLFSFYDNPELYHKICEDLLEWQIATIDEMSQYIKADFLTIAEDMSYNNGPMISKELFDEFIKPYYEKLVPEIKKYGTKVFVDSDGDILKAVPWFVNFGIEGVLPLEHQAGVDLKKIRDDYPNFLMLGGFDKMSLFNGKAAIKAEFERILPIIKSGRYIPGMDHQTPPGVPLDDYKYYVSLLKEYTKYAGVDLK